MSDRNMPRAHKPAALTSAQPSRWSRTEVVLLAALIGLLLWVAGQVLLLVFAGLLLAVAIDGLARPLVTHARLPRSLSVVAVVLALALLLVGGARTIAPQFMEQFGQLWEQLAGLAGQAQEAAAAYPWLERMIAGPDGEGAPLGGVLGSVASATVTVLGTTAAMVLVLAIALFAAAEPGLYQRGFVRLVPLPYRPRARETLIRLGHALRWWLLGQLVSMVLLGTTTAIGLLLLGVELWLGLAVLVGLLTFVPFLGPIIAGIPVVLISFTEGFEIGLAVLVFYVIVQNIEGNIVTPMIQQRAVSLPPALLIGMQVLFGTLFGIAGLILAAPLAVIIMIAVTMLYVEDVLGDRPASA